MRVTEYKLPGSDVVYTMGGEPDERVPADAVDVVSRDIGVPEQMPEAPMPAWGFPRIDGK